ncbi:MAG TPA: hypothetical protein VIJ24_07255 [Verrucomicrobiae bacterium]|jgi:hypothetical protein
MSTVQDIESAIERLDDRSLGQLSGWFEEFLAHKTNGQPQAPDSRAFAKWRGHGQLPVGKNTDDYLRLTRDGQTCQKRTSADN